MGGQKPQGFFARVMRVKKVTSQSDFMSYVDLSVSANKVMPKPEQEGSSHAVQVVWKHLLRAGISVCSQGPK